jgi:hypothetical protein
VTVATSRDPVILLLYRCLRQNARRKLVAKAKQQKIFTKFKRKKTLIMKINNEKKKALIRRLFIKNFMQKLITMKKKKKERALNATFI